MMSNTAIKNRIMKRLAQEEDSHVLRSIDILLRDGTKEDALRRRVNEMAVRSEEAIRKGEVMGLAEARKLSKKVLKDIAAGRERTRPVASRKPTAHKG